MCTMTRQFCWHIRLCEPPSPSARLLAERIAALYECKDPEKMAEELIALSSAEGKTNDDMSVAVALVQKEKKDRKTDV